MTNEYRLEYVKKLIVIENKNIENSLKDIIARYKEKGICIDLKLDGDSKKNFHLTKHKLFGLDEKEIQTVLFNLSDLVVLSLEDMIFRSICGANNRIDHLSLGESVTNKDLDKIAAGDIIVSRRNRLFLSNNGFILEEILRPGSIVYGVIPLVGMFFNGKTFAIENTYNRGIAKEDFSNPENWK